MLKLECWFLVQENFNNVQGGQNLTHFVLYALTYKVRNKIHILYLIFELFRPVRKKSAPRITTNELTHNVSQIFRYTTAY